MPASIISLATAKPEFEYTQSQTTDWIGGHLCLSDTEKKELTVLHRATGVAFRQSVLPDFLSDNPILYSKNGSSPDTASRMKVYREFAAPLATKASEKCLQNHEKKSITHLIAVSCTGMYAPGLDIDLVKALDLNANVHRTSLTFMGCYGAFTGLKLAAALAQTEGNRVLMVCVELCTLHFQFDKSADSLLSSALFADGAAAVLIENSSSGLALEQFETALLPKSGQEMSWEICNTGFRMGLSSYVPDLIGQGIGELLSRLKVSKADLYALHPGGRKILKVLEQCLGLEKSQIENSYQILREHGNMSSATFLFVLETVWKQQNNKDKTVLGMAFGPGLTIESVLMCFR
jgi:predicted naringenin-chalcone synthase